MPRRGAMFKQTPGLDITGGGFQTDETLIKVAIDVDVAKFPALEAGFIVMGMVMGKGCIIVAACPPDFNMCNSDLFLLGQRRQRGRGSRVLESSSHFFNESLGEDQLLQVSV